MAKKAQNGTASKGKKSSTKNSAPRKRAASPQEKSTRRKLGAPAAQPVGYVDDRVKRNVISILCIVCAIALLFIVIVPSDAVVASFLSLALHKGLGIGAFVLPVVLLIVAFLVSSRTLSKPGSSRIIIGLTVIFVGVLVFAALIGPGTTEGGNASTDIFSDRYTFTHGGLVGAGIGFVLIMLLGLPVAIVIAVGIIAIGLAIVGFSLRKVLAAYLARREEKRRRAEEELSVFPDSPYIPVATPVQSRRLTRVQSDNGGNSDRTRLLNDDPISTPDNRQTQLLDDAPETHQITDQEEWETPRFVAPADPHFEPLPPLFLQDDDSPDYASPEPSSTSPTRRLDSLSDEQDETITESAFVPLRPHSALSESLGASRRDPYALEGEMRPMTRRLGKRPTAEDIPEIEQASSTEESTEASKPKRTRKPKKTAKAASGKSDNDSFELPDMGLLKVSRAKGRSKELDDELAATAAHLQQTMEDFGIGATVVDWIAGPTVTLFEIDLPPGVRVSRLMALKDDLALALAAPGVRIFAPIPKTHYVGIEVPNNNRENVLLGDILKSVEGGPLEVAIGKDVEGNPIVEDLARMPHLLIGGTTGSGKSVGINAMIMSILMRSTPSQVRFIMIDPKRVEFAPYEGIPHLYVPVVTDPKEAASALAWAVAEMDLRLKTFEGARVRNISTYNDLVLSGNLRKSIDKGDIEESKIKHPEFIDEPMPYIVIVIDELADLMMNVGKEVEFSISRIAQLARAAGIHLIIATQRPSANVVTGLIKANITTRVAYNVASGLDSRVILDTTGAESLIGLGDLLLSKPEFGKPLRVQGCFTSDEEIAAVVKAVKSQGEPVYHDEILKTNLITLGDSSPSGSSGGSSGSDDPLIWEAADIVVSSGLGSTSNIQRKLKVGYARAGRIMDMLEEKGIVGPPNGSKPREVLVDAMDLESLKAFEAADDM